MTGPHPPEPSGAGRPQPQIGVQESQHQPVAVGERGQVGASQRAHRVLKQLAGNGREYAKYRIDRAPVPG
jgi:hypothetical protein